VRDPTGVKISTEEGVWGAAYVLTIQNQLAVLSECSEGRTQQWVKGDLMPNAQHKEDIYVHSLDKSGNGCLNWNGPEEVVSFHEQRCLS
jgi:hypothetical protein